MARLLKAPTVEITRLLQKEIVEWLDIAGEFRAACWFEEYWCGEKGNYTNATAGYVGNCVASGIESHWRYLREDTVGTSGTNQRISLEVFSGSLVRYMETSSKRHADKILDEKTGSHMFPRTPKISAAMWKRVQSFDVQRLLLANFEGSADARKTWLEKMEYFVPTEIDPNAAFSDLIVGFHEAGRSMQAISRSNVRGLVVPSFNFYKYITVTKKIVDAQQMMQIVDEEYAMYKVLFHETAEFHNKFPHMSIEETLDCMENFNRIEPLKKKCGDMLARCSCNDSYRKFCCVESIVFSMLFSPDLVVPSTERIKQLKEKIKEKVNPFNADAMRKKKAAKEKEKTSTVQPAWAPNIPKSKSVLPSSAASLRRPVSAKGSKNAKIAEEDQLVESEIGEELADPPVVPPPAEVCAAPEDAVQSLKSKAAPQLPRVPRKRETSKVKLSRNTRKT